jgi:hypothetical protein
VCVCVPGNGNRRGHDPPIHLSRSALPPRLSPSTAAAASAPPAWQEHDRTSSAPPVSESAPTYHCIPPPPPPQRALGNWPHALQRAPATPRAALVMRSRGVFPTQNTSPRGGPFLAGWLAGWLRRSFFGHRHTCFSRLTDVHVSRVLLIQRA